MIDTFPVALPNGVTLSCRACGPRDAPLVVFLHGFPEAAFVWDEMLEHFGPRWRCVAPNLRGYEHSSQPQDVEAYRAKHLVEDLALLIQHLGGQLHALVAHDWGGAVAWNLAIARPELMDRLVVINSPHPWTFARDLAASPEQQRASAYMNFLRRPDAEALLAENDYARLWPFLAMGDKHWLTPALKQRYRDVWRLGLTGAVNYYRASPLYPPTDHEPGAQKIIFTPEQTTVHVPTLVIWGLGDTALPPHLLAGLALCIPDLRIERIPDGTHWIVHEQPQRMAALLAQFFA